MCQVGIQGKDGMCFLQSVVKILGHYQQGDDIKKGNRTQQSMKLSLSQVQSLLSFQNQSNSFLYMLWHLTCSHYVCVVPVLLPLKIQHHVAL